MKCNKCGYDLPASAKFCRSCGASQISGLESSGAVQNQVEMPAAAIPATSSRTAATQEATPQTLEPDSSGTMQDRIEKPAAPIPTASSQSAVIQEAVPQTVPSGAKSKAPMYAVVGFLVVMALSGVGYWGWTQKELANEQAVQLAKQEAAAKTAQQAKQEAAAKTAQQAKQEAEEKAAQQAKQEAEEKAAQQARQEAEEKAAQQARQEAEEKAVQQAKRLAEENAVLMAKLEAKEKSMQLAKQKADKQLIQQENELKKLKEAEEKGRIEAEAEARRQAEAEREVKAKSADIVGAKLFKDCANCPEMVRIPPGSFNMGAYPNEKGSTPAEYPQHKVTISRPFALAKTEITRGQFAYFVKESGYSPGNECVILNDGKWEKRIGFSWQNPGYSQQDNHPVACINWNDANAYVKWLSAKSGRAYRLPSEVEWEYAARGGSAAARYWGDDPNRACSYANVGDRSLERIPGVDVTNKVVGINNCNDGYAFTAPVASFSPNAFGLHDMIGNVFELTEDCWNQDYNGAPNDGRAWTTGDCSKHVRRGGSWSVGHSFGRSATRRSVESTESNCSYGFRPAISLQ